MEDVEKTEVELENDTEEQHDNAQEDNQEEIKDWKAEALKNRAIADRLKIKLSKVQPQKTIIQSKPEHDDNLVQTVNSLKLSEDKRQFGFENGLSPEETDFIFKISGGKPSKEILKDPFVESGLEGYRAKKRIENNIPGASSRSSIFTEKSFQESSEEERKQAFESKMKGIVRK